MPNKKLNVLEPSVEVGAFLPSVFAHFDKKQYFENEIESYHQRKVDTDKFLKMIEKYTNIEELTVPMINEYIEKVVVHEATGGRKGIDRKQQVDVYFNFIGNCQVPQKADIEKMA
ncbi:DUF4368 domain-containing protein [Rothia nasimurium]